jgi:uncharacterized protein (TIGR03437 family)
MRKCFVVCVMATLQAHPAFAQANTVVGAGYSAPVPLTVAPGQVFTLFVQGIGASLTQPVRAPSGPLPTTLAGISVTLKQFSSETPVPLLSVQPVSTCSSNLSQGSCGTLTAVTVQIPFELQTLCLPCARPVSVAPQLFVSENGRIGTSVDLTPLADQVHILTACDVLLPNAVERVNLTGLPCPPMVTHADGTLVSATKPAKAGEELVAYAVGLGPTNPPVATGQPATTHAPTTEVFAIDYNYHPNALPAKPLAFSNTGLFPPQPVPYTALTPVFAGLYQVNFYVIAAPPGTPPCVDLTTVAPGANVVQSNLTVSFGGAFSFDGAGICVAPS